MTDGEIMSKRWAYDHHCPDYRPLTFWQRLKERFGYKQKREPCIYKVGDLFVCSPRTYEWIKTEMTIPYREQYPKYEHPKEPIKLSEQSEREACKMIRELRDQWAKIND